MNFIRPKCVHVAMFEDSLISLPEYSHTEMKAMTDNYAKQCLVGEGKFAHTFKGNLNNYEVAVKKYKTGVTNHEKSDFSISNDSLFELTRKEADVLIKLSHDSIIKLLSFSEDGEAPFLIYEYTKYGSLRESLLPNKSRENPLNWNARHKIAKGIIQGLHYLHTLKPEPIVHGNLTSQSILLDNKHQPKISNFTSVRINFDEHPKMCKPEYINPYRPHEYVLKQYKSSSKLDSYAYGIILFEIATGLSAYDESRYNNKFLKDIIWKNFEFGLPFLRDKLAGDENSGIYNKLITIGLGCSNKIEVIRPDIICVYKKFIDYKAEHNLVKTPVIVRK